MGKFGWFILGVVVGAAFCGEETAWAERYDGARFDLFNRCRPVALGAGVVSAVQAGEIGLTEADLRVTAESRLRSARLYTARAHEVLFIEVNVYSAAFSIEVAFFKRLFDPVSNQHGHAKTVTYGATGTHGGDGTYILQSLSKYIDQFIVDYLRVNEADCP